MQVQSTEIKEIQVVKKFCDICGKEAKGRPCRICQRDICNEHAYRHLDEWGGDSSTKYCNDCWKIGNLFRRRMSVLSEIYIKEIEDLEQEWEKKAKEKILSDKIKKEGK